MTSFNLTNPVSRRSAKSSLYFHPMLIRSSREIHENFMKLLQARSEGQFNKLMQLLEDEMDDVIFILDQLELANKQQKISLIEDFLKEGYELMSIYSKCFDQIIDKKVHKEE